MFHNVIHSQFHAGAGTVWTPVEEPLELLLARVSERECHRTVREGLANSSDSWTRPIAGEIGNFASLKDRGAISELVTDLAAMKDLSVSEAITSDFHIVITDPTIGTIVVAIIREFNQPTKVNSTVARSEIRRLSIRC
jgi:hypothetical protein